MDMGKAIRQTEVCLLWDAFYLLDPGGANPASILSSTSTQSWFSPDVGGVNAYAPFADKIAKGDCTCLNDVSYIKPSRGLYQ